MTPTDELTLRSATPDDLPRLADLHLRARDAAFPAMPRGVHDRDEVLRHVTSWDLSEREVWLADGDAGPVGYAAVHGDWLEDLYVDPAAQRVGVGSALLDLAKSLRPGGFCLWVFESNAPARGFYARHGLVELERTDGSANEERSPDIRLAWPGSEPLVFYRRLIDDVDELLGDLLARRAALTRAVQPHKADATRDLERERAIAEAMAGRAPGLGSERLRRIVHAIITESLAAAEQR